MQLTQINSLVTTLLRYATGHGKSFAQRHRSHILSACRVIISLEPTWGAVHVFHAFLWSLISTGSAGAAARTYFPCVVRSQDHVLNIAPSVPLSISQTMVASLVCRLLRPKLLALIRSRTLMLLTGFSSLWTNMLLLYDLLLASCVSCTYGSSLI